MRLASGYIRLERVRLRANHGVLDQERTVGAEFEVSLRVGYPLETATESDQVEDTLNYAELYDLLKYEMGQPSKLLEHVAGRIARAVFSKFPAVTIVDVELRKLNPPIGADAAGAAVELHYTK